MDVPFLPPSALDRPEGQGFRFRSPTFMEMYPCTVLYTMPGLAALLGHAPWQDQYIANWSRRCPFGEQYTLDEAEALITASLDLEAHPLPHSCGADVYPVLGAPSVLLPSGKTRPTPDRLAFFRTAYEGYPRLLDALDHGVPFPPKGAAMAPLFLRSPPLPPEHAAFLTDEYDQWEMMGAFKPYNRAQWARTGPPILVSPALVASDAKLRNIIDFRAGNLLTSRSHVKYEALADFVQTIQPGDFLAKMDFRSAYFHIPLAESAAPYMCLVRRGRTGRDELWYPTTLIFGWTGSCGWMEAFTAPLKRALRAAGLDVHELDDVGLDAGPDVGYAFDRYRAMLRIAAAHGWLIPWDKTQGPSAFMDLLGWHLDSFYLLVSPTERRIQKLWVLLDSVPAGDAIPLLLAARIAGSLASMAGMLRHALRWAQPFLDCLRRAAPVVSWHATGSLGPAAHAVPALLRRHWHWLTPMPMHPAHSMATVVQSDATPWSQSYATYAGVGPVSDLRTPIAAARREKEGAIDAQELEAHCWAIEDTGLHDTVIQPVLDSTTALSYVEKGGGSVQRLGDLAWQLTQLVAERRLDYLRPIWVPSGENVVPDALTRVPLPALAFFPEVSSVGLRGFWRWLQTSLPGRAWHLWPDGDALIGAVEAVPVLGRQLPRATVLQLVAADVGHAFLVAPPSHLMRRVLRWILAKQLAAAVFHPIWREEVWWPLVQACTTVYTIPGAVTGDGHPYRVALYMPVVA